MANTLKRIVATGFIATLLSLHTHANVCVFKPPKAVQYVCGFVVDSRGQAIPQTTVTVSKDGKALATARTTEVGQFDFPNLANGHYELLVQNSHFKPFDFRVTVSKAKNACSRQLRVQLALAAECEDIQVVRAPKGK